MNQQSDSESRSSDDGVRYKTESIRYKTRNEKKSTRSRSRSPRRDNKNRHDASGHTFEADSFSKKEKSYGPKLPSMPLLENKEVGPSFSSSNAILYKSKSEKSKNFNSYGPTPRPNCKNETIEDEDHEKKLQCKTIGPALPSSFKNLIEDNKIVGPTLPPNFRANSSDLPSDVDQQLPQGVKKGYGPQLPPSMTSISTQSNDKGLEEDEDFESYGPLPPGMASTSKAHVALEERALQMKIDKLNPNGNDEIVREEWMTELPEISKKFGLGPRQFRANPKPDFSDRSSWTDTPKDKAKKAIEPPKKVDVKKDAEVKELKRYDEEQEKIAKKHKKHKREKSLVEMHQDKLNKKKKDEGPSVRRPFSRETDLKVNHFDEAQKKAVLKKAQLLNDRFSRGQSKFL